MNTPICDFVQNYTESNAIRLHMPGHKGRGVLGVEHLDITEIEGADVLYKARGIICESESNAGELFGTGLTKYSTEGSSLSIRAMLYLAMLYGRSLGRRPLVLAGRNAHHTFMTAAALLDLEVEWLYPEDGGNLVSCPITSEGLEAHLEALDEEPAAVYVTSPDYLGNVLDIRSLARVCHGHGVPLLVDNAHGAYLHFLKESRHPIALGADMCCDSAHKTLPVLTGGGYLHISKQAPGMYGEHAERAMSLFASTSPSYLILQSLDAANRYLDEKYRESLQTLCERLEGLKNRLSDAGYSLIGQEPLKLAVGAKSRGYRGEELANALAREGIVCEFADLDFLVLMFTPDIEEGSLAKVEKVLSELPVREAILEQPPVPARAERVCSIREALFSESRTCDISSAQGQVLASATISCPPAIPILLCGERIDEHAVGCFAYYGVERCQIMIDK